MEDNEKDLQAKNATTNQETSSVDETQAATQNTAVNTNDAAKQPFKVFETEDDYNKALQSTSSKAKGDILKELGINSVDAFKEQLAQVSKYESVANELEALRKTVEELTNNKLALESSLLSNKYPMSEEAGKIFAELVSAKRGDKELLQVADEVFNTLQNGFKQIPTKVVFGADRSEATMNDDPFVQGFKK